MLWNFIKSGMLRHPGSRLSEGDWSCTFAEAAAAAEHLAAQLPPGKYAGRARVRRAGRGSRADYVYVRNDGHAEGRDDRC